MDPSNGVQQHQEMSNYQVENMLVCPKTQQQDKKPKPQPQEALKCPRCESTNTKFCYYNNYSLSQPRYFCKSCRRYWTKGGTLRNVPVGGGCRKNKRSLLSSSKFRAHQDPLQPLTPNGNSCLNGLIPSNLTYELETNDLTLAIIQKLQNLNSSCYQSGFESNHHGDFNMMGNCCGSTKNHYDVPLNHNAIQGHNNYSETLALLDSVRSSKHLDTQSNPQNLYYGLGDGAIAQIENGGGAAVMVKDQDVCIGRENHNRVLLGRPWSNGDFGMMDAISGRGSNWNNVVGSSWQGLLNSPLM